MFDTRQMEYMIAIAEEQSLTRAAERLFISQSALSQQLKKLYETGLPPLFEYKHGKMLLTEAGKLYINGARTILNIRNTTMMEIMDPSRNDYPPLRIVIPVSEQESFLKRILPKVKEVYPFLAVDLRTRDSMNTEEMLQKEKPDIAVFLAAKNKTPSKATVIREEKLYPAAAPELEIHSSPAILNRLSTNLFLFQTQALRSWNLNPKVDLYCDDQETVFDIVSSGNYYTIAEEKRIRNDSRLEIKEIGEPFCYDLALYKSPERILSEPMDYLIELLSEE
ncbi:MAG: LysR family transcriptional regulator [Lachnospiraceae bacterium]|nr:LysR family transcriptional regulator [Lachnospiraceae bacterium]